MDINEVLRSAGLPKDLKGNLGVVPDYPELLSIWEAFTARSVHRVIILYGMPSPRKETLCAVLFKAIIERRKQKGLWLTPAKVPATQWSEGSNPFPAVGVTAVMGIDMMSPSQVKLLVGCIRDQIPEDRCFILEVSSKDALVDLIGRVPFAYLASYSVALELESKVPEILTLKKQVK